MAGSTIGNILRMTTFGESHGEALGCVLDGFPAGMKLSEKDIQPYLNRRRPGTRSVSTKRTEEDKVEILSGVFQGVTTGAPIAMIIRNKGANSKDYDALKHTYRPGHADYTFDAKYAIRDYRGGGRSSGRETAARVCAGAVCMKLLKEMGIDVYAYTVSIGDTIVNPDRFDRKLILKTETCMPDKVADAEAKSAIAAAAKLKDSLGGVIACAMENVPAGLGDPVFEKLDASLTKAVMSIGAAKAVEIGRGIYGAFMDGAAFNDAFVEEDGEIKKVTNNAGGILGGISDGDTILLRAFFKPTPSIAMPQKSVNDKGKNTSLTIKGRHDPVIVPRAVVVVESMCAFTLLDALLLNMSAKASNVKTFYARPNS
ncbi:MAG: chorismate synthase [Lachnospiraceae bacterium]|nr:chorismate synthase [Lachnospiraceae bacterium]